MPSEVKAAAIGRVADRDAPNGARIVRSKPVRRRRAACSGDEPEVARCGGEIREGARRRGDRDQVAMDVGAFAARREEALGARALGIGKVTGRVAGDEGEVVVWVIRVLHLDRRTARRADWFPRQESRDRREAAAIPPQRDDQQDETGDEQRHGTQRAARPPGLASTAALSSGGSLAPVKYALDWGP